MCELINVIGSALCSSLGFHVDKARPSRSTGNLFGTEASVRLKLKHRAREHDKVFTSECEAP